MKTPFIKVLRASVFTLLVGSCLAVSCNKDNPQPNPCTGASPFKATFDILEEVGDTLIATDTAVTNNRVFFKAPKGYDSYTWYVDNEKVDNFYTQKDPTQFFLGFMYPAKDVKITLVAKKKPNLTCFPKDDGVDTVTKYLQVREVWDTPIRGRYFGYYKSNPKDTATVEIKVAIENFKEFFAISNINKGCNKQLKNNLPLGYSIITWRGCYIDSRNEADEEYMCYAPNIRATLAPNHQDIIINFSYTPDSNKPDKRVFDAFIGKRIK